MLQGLQMTAQRALSAFRGRGLIVGLLGAGLIALIVMASALGRMRHATPRGGAGEPAPMASSPDAHGEKMERTAAGTWSEPGSPPAPSRVLIGNGDRAAARPVARRRTAATGAPTLQELEAAFLAPGGGAGRAAMMERLRRAGDAALPALEAALRHRSPELRRAAALALKANGSTKAVRLMLAALRAEADPALRQEMQGLFEGWETPQVAEAFAAALRESPDEASRAATAALLGPILNGGVAERLLGEFGRPAAGEPFRQAVAAIFEQTQSQAATEALAAWLRTGEAASGIKHFAPVAAKVGDHALISSMLDAYARLGDKENAEAFLGAFSSTSNPESASAFAEVLSDQGNPDNAWRIASTCLASLGTPLAVNVLVKEIRNAAPGGERQSLMLGDLGRVRNPQALEALAQAYAANQSEPALARATARALLNLGEPALLARYGEQAGRQWIETLRAAAAQTPGAQHD